MATSSNFDTLVQITETLTRDVVLERLGKIQAEQDALRAMLRMIKRRDRLEGKQPTKPKGGGRE